MECQLPLCWTTGLWPTSWRVSSLDRAGEDVIDNSYEVEDVLDLVPENAEPEEAHEPLCEPMQPSEWSDVVSEKVRDLGQFGTSTALQAYARMRPQYQSIMKT
jgi:hypothetical protein